MQKKIMAIKARQNLAVVIPVEEYQRLLRQREKDFSVLDEIWAANEGISPEAAERDIAATIRYDLHCADIASVKRHRHERSLTALCCRSKLKVWPSASS